MLSRNIVLVGFMGSGKSMVSNKLANILKREVVSTDTLVEKREGRPIKDIFRDSGEAHFRRLEREVVREVAQRTSIIIDCGGGVVLDADNIADLKKNGTLFYLSASPHYIYQNIKGGKHRPLLDVDDPEAKIAELLEARRPYYEQADVVIDADKPIDQITEDIMKVVRRD